VRYMLCYVLYKTCLAPVSLLVNGLREVRCSIASLMCRVLAARWGTAGGYITALARQAVASVPEARAFPWRMLRPQLCCAA
jgi:hypothetical protein